VPADPEIIEFDLRTAQMQASCKKLNLLDVRKDQPMAKAYGYHGEILPGQTEAVYAAAPWVDSAFDARSSRNAISVSRAARKVAGSAGVTGHASCSAGVHWRWR
jgi:hypothetical protein